MKTGAVKHTQHANNTVNETGRFCSDQEKQAQLEQWFIFVGVVLFLSKQFEDFKGFGEYCKDGAK